MRQLKAFGAFWYDFIIGDDWRVAAAVVAGLALAAILAHVARVNAWWAFPAFVVAALVWSLHRATARRLGASGQARPSGTPAFRVRDFRVFIVAVAWRAASAVPWACPDATEPSSGPFIV